MSQTIFSLVEAGDTAKVNAAVSGWFGFGKKKIHSTDSAGRTPLMVAARKGHWQIVELLVMTPGSARIDRGAG